MRAERDESKNFGRLYPRLVEIGLAGAHLLTPGVNEHFRRASIDAPLQGLAEITELVQHVADAMRLTAPIVTIKPRSPDSRDCGW